MTMPVGLFFCSKLMGRWPINFPRVKRPRPFLIPWLCCERLISTGSDFLNRAPCSIFRALNIVVCLQIHPALHIRPEKTRKPERRVGADASPFQILDGLGPSLRWDDGIFLALTGCHGGQGDLSCESRYC